MSDTIVCLHVERRMSANLEMYLECNISERNVKIIGRLTPGLSMEEFITKKPTEESITKLVSISGEIIIRNIILVYGKIIDLNFIKFEFVCELCTEGTLLSLSKCINGCQ